MAEENEKKPEFVVHKKEQEPSSAKAAGKSGASAEKKRVIVVKKKAPQAAAPAKTPADSQKKVVVKSAAKVEPKKDTASDSAAPKKVENKKTTFELNPSRPNVKAGNLSDKGRQNSKGFNQNRNGSNGKTFNRSYITGSNVYKKFLSPEIKPTAKKSLFEDGDKIKAFSSYTNIQSVTLNDSIYLNDKDESTKLYGVVAVVHYENQEGQEETEISIFWFKKTDKGYRLIKVLNGMKEFLFFAMQASQS